MNVIVANKNENDLKALNIDVIKTVSGQYDPNQLKVMFQNFFFQRLILDITAIKNYKDINALKTLSKVMDMDKVILLLDEETSDSFFISELVSNGIYNFAKDIEEINYLLEHPNNYYNVRHLQNTSASYNQMVIQNNDVQKSSLKIIGFKNVTSQAGATSLIYMLKKQLQKKYKVIAIEINKRDFMCFNDREMISVSEDELNRAITNKNLDIILIDLNQSSKSFSLCHEVIYLIEPSMIKLHKMMLVNPDILNRLKNKKIILNKSLLSNTEIKDFENESKLSILFNIPPLNERKNDFPLLEQLISKLLL